MGAELSHAYADYDIETSDELIDKLIVENIPKNATNKEMVKGLLRIKKASEVLVSKHEICKILSAKRIYGSFLIQKMGTKQKHRKIEIFLYECQPVVVSIISRKDCKNIDVLEELYD